MLGFVFQLLPSLHPDWFWLCASLYVFVVIVSNSSSMLHNLSVLIIDFTSYCILYVFFHILHDVNDE